MTRFVPPGRCRDAAAFRAQWRAVAPDLDCVLQPSGKDGPLGEPLTLPAGRLDNRFAIHPMEGWDATVDGRPTDRTLRRWRRFGESGAKLIWGGEAFAVCAAGRANPAQLCLWPGRDAATDLAALRAAAADAHREAGHGGAPPVIGLQLTHSGRWSQPEPGMRAPRIAHRHPVLDARVVADDAAVLTDAELEDIALAYVAAARAAQRAGFAFVDVKCCHGYLLHELLGARGRPGRYGGSFARRSRFVLDLIAAIQRECPGLEVAVRLSLIDVFPHAVGASGTGEPVGWQDHVPYGHGFGVDAGDPRRTDLGEPLRLLALLADAGVTMINATAGSPYYCPHLQRPAAYPPNDGYPPPEDPLRGVAAQLRAVRAAKAAHPELVFVGSGYSYLQEWLPHVAEAEVGGGHVDVVGLGRMVLSYPRLPADVLAGRPLDRRAICRTLSDCTTAARLGLPSGCYPLDEAYKRAPEAARLRAAKRGGATGR